MTTVRRPRVAGQSLAEFALVVPLFFGLLFAIIEFGRAVYTIQTLNNAAREGARYAIVHGAESQCPSGPFPAAWGSANPCDPTGANVVAAVKRFAIAVPDAGPSDFEVDVRWCDSNDGDIGDCPGALGDGDNRRNQTVRIAVTYVFRPIIPVLPTFTLTGGSTLVINH